MNISMEDLSQSQTIQIGDHVTHGYHGSGYVIAVNGTQIEVRFSSGVQTVVHKASLEVILNG